MKILIINPILYTAEHRIIPQVQTIKDTMIYDLCLAFLEKGHDITLYAADAYKPTVEEEYPFKIEWGQCKCTKLLKPSRLPYMPGIKKFLRNNTFDLVISSEVFSISTYYAYRNNKKTLLAWQEMARHQNMYHRIPSKVWYGFVTRLFMKDIHVVARSEEAKEFIRNYCKNVEDSFIDHGVNLHKFNASIEKENQFIVSSQIVWRKKIEGIIDNFSDYVKKIDKDCKLYIVGKGDADYTELLKKQVSELGMDDSIIFTGKLKHDKLIPILARSQAMLVNTERDNNMVSIVESIAVGTPVITTEVPLNASYIKSHKLGVAKDKWDFHDLEEIVAKNKEYVKNCMEYRKTLSTTRRVEQFIDIVKKEK